MRCLSCGKENLPGGVRCIYCGVHYPKLSEFDLDIPTWKKSDPEQTSAQSTSGKKRGLWATLALIALKGKSLLAMLKFSKVFLTFGTMLVSMAAYGRIFGWRFGVGFVIIIFIHEMGHVTVNKMKGLEQSAPVFIPFMGAVIFLKNFPDDPTIQSESGAGGPVAGMLAALVCLAIGLITGNPFWMALANIGFVMNLFNLIPFPPLDGSHISTVFSPKLWSGILVTLLLWVIKFPSPMLWMVLLVSFLFRMGRHDVGRHQLATPQVQFRMGVVFILLCIILSSGAVATSKFSIGTAKSPSESSSTSTQNATSNGVSPTSTDVDQSDPPAKSEQMQLDSAIVILIRAAFIVIPVVVWIAVSLLLGIGVGTGINSKHFALALSMSLFQLVLYLVVHYGPIPNAVRWQLVGASFAASAAAFVFSAYQAFHLNQVLQRPTIYCLTRGTLSWAAFGAFLIAYAFDSLAVAAVLLVVIGGYLLTHKWLYFSIMGDFMIQLGKREQAIAYYQKAAADGPTREDAIMLWNKIVSTHIVLDHGSDTLKALENRDALLIGSKDWDTDTQIGTIPDLMVRATALMLIDRHQECLAICESVLQAPIELLPNGNSRLLQTHIRLAKIARFQGWMDETVAQADLCLGAISKRSKAGIAALHCLKAAAFIDLNQLDAALVSCDMAATQNKEAYYASWVSVLKAQIDLKKNMPGEASRKISRAMHLMPDNLEFRYWYGRTLLSHDKKEEGFTVLNEMRNQFPQEHWGKLAEKALAG